MHVEQELAQSDVSGEPLAPPDFEDNDEAIRAWDGPLFDRFVQFRHIICEGLTAHGANSKAIGPGSDRGASAGRDSQIVINGDVSVRP